MSTETYLGRLAGRIGQTGGALCVGLDPDPAALPAGFAPDVEGVERFARLIVEASTPFAAAFKPNLAFFEAFGSAGLAALERVRAAIPAAIPVIADAKRGDIGSTAARQAAGMRDVLRADAVTVSPYLGFDAVVPFLEGGLFAYVLCRTSNPSAGQLQDLPVGSVYLHVRVARMVEVWDGGGGRLGLVVGATAADEMARIREAVPGLPFLVPGVGAQGGAVAAALHHGPARSGPAGALPGGAVLVNVSRAIAEAALSAGRDPGEAIAGAADAWRSHLRVLHSDPVPSGGDSA